jgi:alkylresorcinol/alkylpyrone synthase
MTCIDGVETSSPDFKLEKKELPVLTEKWLKENTNTKEKFLRISGNCGVESRYFVMPYEEILKLKGLESRAAVFEEMGEKLLGQAVEKLISKSRFSPSAFSDFIFTSCSVPVIPSIDAKIVLRTNFPNTISRTPVFQHGCAGGVAGLSLGCRLASLGKPVMLTSLEICSLVFQYGNTAGSQLVGASIFADGAGAMLLSPSKGILNYIDSVSFLIPNSRELMGYDLYDDGFHLRLDRELPSVLIEQAPEIIKSFLEKHDFTKEDINYWLFHPGGKKILDFLVDKFRLEDSQCHWARDVLRENGNMSSATIYFVIDNFLKSAPLEEGQKTLVMGIGPGLTIELVLFEVGRAN